MRTAMLILVLGLASGCTDSTAPTSGEREIPIEVREGSGGTPDLTNAATELMPTDGGERPVPGFVSDRPSGSPDLSDPNIDTSVMPGDPPPRTKTP
jgi:hypothetical protein